MPPDTPSADEAPHQTCGTPAGVLRRHAGSGALPDLDAIRAVLEHVPAAIFVQASGRFAVVNASARALFGASAGQELVGEPVRDFFHPDHRGQVDERIRRLNSEGKAARPIEEQIVRVDGRTIWVEVTANPWTMGNQPGALVVLREITRNRSDREALRRQDERLRGMGEIGRIGGWDLDLATSTASWTDGIAQIHGFDPGVPPDTMEALGQFTPDSRSRLDPAMRDAIEEALPFDLDLELISTSGTRKWVRSKCEPILDGGRVVRLRGILQDITESKLAELRIAEERERLAVTLRSLGDGVAATGTDGRVKMLNPAAEALAGCTEPEACGRPIDEIFRVVSGTDRSRRVDLVGESLRSGKIVEYDERAALVLHDRTERLVSGRAAPIRDRDERIVGAVLVLRDVTERQRLLEIAQRAEKLEALGLLAGGIAHDFNNLLCAVYGNLELARHASSPAAPPVQFIDLALATYDDARDLTSQLLTFAKGGGPARRVLPLGPVLRRSTTFALSGSTVAPVFDIDPDIWPCEIDAGQIGQAIDAIATNAREAMPAGGILRISARNITLQTPNPGALPGGEYVRIALTDAGCGIPEAHLARVFDPFFTTKAVGSGMGLATTHSIVRRHDGWISIESSPGRGTTVAIILPAARGECSEIVVAPLHRGATTKRILVMDDQPHVRDVVSGLLRSLGYSVEAVEDGREAVALARQAEADRRPFDAIILDLTVPDGQGGREAVADLRRWNPEIPIFVASGYSDDPTLAAPRSWGFTDRIRKPFHREDLGELLGRHLGHAR